MQRLLGEPASGAPELRALAPLLALQRRVSHLPRADELLTEDVVARGQQLLFLLPFAGRLVHEGLASLLAARWGRLAPNSFSYAVNDYGLVIAPAKVMPVDETLLRQLLSPDDLLADIEASLNLAELGRRQFRDIARVAGLLPPSLPGRALRTLRQLQASGSVLYDVLRQHDPGHILLRLARREVLDAQLDLPRLHATLEALQRRQLVLRRPKHPTPLSFPLWAERMRGALSTEDWRTRVERAAARLEARYA
jgi:ATP-dependent Lhr-like helicase